MRRNLIALLFILLKDRTEMHTTSIQTMNISLIQQKHNLDIKYNIIIIHLFSQSSTRESTYCIYFVRIVRPCHRI